MKKEKKKNKQPKCCPQISAVMYFEEHKANSQSSPSWLLPAAPHERIATSTVLTDNWDWSWSVPTYLSWSDSQSLHGQTVNCKDINQCNDRCSYMHILHLFVLLTINSL